MRITHVITMAPVKLDIGAGSGSAGNLILVEEDEASPALALTAIEPQPNGSAVEVADIEVIDAEALEIIRREHLDKVFSNGLLVHLICSFVDSRKDLANLRQVNRIFQREATGYFKGVHQPVNFLAYQQIKLFLALMENRQNLNMTPFPFTAFQMDLALCGWFRMASKFAELVGPHVRRYFLAQGSTSVYHRTPLQHGHFVAMLLLNSPQLEEINIISGIDIKLSPRDQDLLPVQLPKLSRIHVEYPFRSEDSAAFDENAAHLLDILLSKVTSLKSFRIPGAPDAITAIPDMRIVRILSQSHRQSNPSLFMKKLTIFPGELNNILELIDSKLQFEEIQQIELHYRHFRHDPNPGDLLLMMQLVSSWLVRQGAVLKSLGLHMFLNSIPINPPSNFELVSLYLPPLRLLEDLTIDYCRYGWYALPRNLLPVTEIHPIDFPALKRLSLSWYKDEYGTFNNAMPNVYKLQLNRQQSSFNGPFWMGVLPNLTSLHLDFATTDNVVIDARNSLYFILTHLTKLEHFTFLLSCCEMHVFDMDFWSLLTGGAPLLAATQTLFNGMVNSGHAQYWSGAPANGVFKRASLGNMRAGFTAKWVRFEPRSRSNLDAILYMTLTRELVKLEQLTIDKISDFCMTSKRKLAYYNRFAEFHQSVAMVMD